ncbi:MAG: cytochrome d terminal oxidase subunit 1 [Acidocella sp. 20-57-95]|nr:MAG: cytochrome d terminal oxidase subunit 1 [Acidocella sp. 20-57-95]OYV59069.1 MAG: cytochrome d terminal oxidase subunit 1 [Acidocella sp. 21-58-7]HQT63839.1 cytochrome ubiquinol oxidase subunit I [Acidocella sp.]HQU04690.1 cytochrome ubiquinol oxidase subunit I [Acidocella sp.]
MPLIDPNVVDLSRLQFALTALYHFLFVPLTLGLTIMLAAMETVYVITGKQVYKDMTHFWGKLFGINFAIGVATGLTMEFEFGTNWSMYSHFVGDVFGTPLAIEGLMAFFMESTFVGLMFFGWDRLSKQAHLAVTYLVALGSNLSALWILVANGFMQNPQGASFDPNTMRMQFNDFAALVFSPDAQAKFVHTSIAGFVAGAMFVMGISAYYLLRGRHREFAARSFRMAALFGLISTLAVVTLGDALGRLDQQVQPTKIAAMEGIWHTTTPPAAPWLITALPNDATQSNSMEIGIPYVLTPLVTHTFDQPVLGLVDIEQANVPRVDNGIKALIALQQYGATHSAASLATFKQYENDMGYGFLAQRYAPNQDVNLITPALLPSVEQQAVLSSIPNVFVTFWSFRVMMALGFYFVTIFAFAAYYSLKNQLEKHPMLLKLCMWSIPLPVLATEFGWVTAEAGRQPWTVFGWLPTFQSASSHDVGYMIFSLAGFALLYSAFIAAELYLMFKFARLGPEDHGAAAHHAPANASIATPIFATPGYANKSWE